MIESTRIRKENVGGFSGVTVIAEKTKDRDGLKMLKITTK